MIVVHRHCPGVIGVAVIGDGVGRNHGPLRVQYHIRGVHGKRRPGHMTGTGSVGLRVPSCKGITCFDQRSCAACGHGLSLQIVVGVCRRGPASADIAVIGDGVRRECGPLRVQGHTGRAHGK